MATTKLLLQESIKNLGRVGDVVEVSPGYARNYLLPQGLAVAPTAGNLKKVEARRKEIEQGNLYGAVSATDIAKALQADGYNIHPDDVLLPGRLDRIDTYTVKVRFAEDL